MEILSSLASVSTNLEAKVDAFSYTQKRKCSLAIKYKSINTA